jgi:RHS repeat-associated protein
MFVGMHALAQSTGTVTYVYTDPQGTPLAEADASGNITATYDYTPYGTTALGSPPNGPGYAGHVNDQETNLFYMQAIYYDKVTVRFISTDALAPRVGNEFNFNRYAYGANNPILNKDKNGEMCGSTTDVSAAVQRMRDTSDSCGPASATVVRAFNSNGNAYYAYADGAVVIQSGARPGRDNNPGDLRHGSRRSVSSKRAVGWDYWTTSVSDRYTARNPFAMFASPEEGYQSLEDTLRTVYGNKTLSEVVPIYAPIGDSNNPGQYTHFVIEKAGLDKSKTMSSLNQNEMGRLSHAIGTIEGYGSPSVKVYNFGLGPFPAQ